MLIVLFEHLFCSNFNTLNQFTQDGKKLNVSRVTDRQAKVQQDVGAHVQQIKQAGELQDNEDNKPSDQQQQPAGAHVLQPPPDVINKDTEEQGMAKQLPDVKDKSHGLEPAQALRDAGEDAAQDASDDKADAQVAQPPDVAVNALQPPDVNAKPNEQAAAQVLQPPQAMLNEPDAQDSKADAAKDAAAVVHDAVVNSKEGAIVNSLEENGNGAVDVADLPVHRGVKEDPANAIENPQVVNPDKEEEDDGEDAGVAAADNDIADGA